MRRRFLTARTSWPGTYSALCPTFPLPLRRCKRPRCPRRIQSDPSVLYPRRTLGLFGDLLGWGALLMTRGPPRGSEISQWQAFASLSTAPPREQTVIAVVSLMCTWASRHTRRLCAVRMSTSSPADPSPALTLRGSGVSCKTSVGAYTGISMLCTKANIRPTKNGQQAGSSAKAVSVGIRSIQYSYISNLHNIHPHPEPKL